MLDLLIGTTNEGKLREYRVLLASVMICCLSPGEVGLDRLAVEETGETLAENAEHKALAYTRASGLYALADDTGLLVDALDGRPGVYSHRYGGPTDRDRNLKLLAELGDIPDEARTARFACVIAVVNPKTHTATIATGTLEGRIAREIKDGNAGFGYDGIFIPAGYDVCLSELSMEQKNALSHRGDAARKIMPFLTRMAQA